MEEVASTSSVPGNPYRQSSLSSSASMSCLVFDGALAKDLNSSEYRLPPTYVGCRRIRASTKIIQQIMKRRRKSYYNKNHNDEEDEDDIKVSVPLDEATEEEKPIHLLLASARESRMTEEIADLCGERMGVPPVLLPGGLAMQAGGIIRNFGTKESLVKYNNNKNSAIIEYDETLAGIWIDQLSHHMEVAETLRQQENMRSLAYRVQPKVWTRFKPSGIHHGRRVQNNDNCNSSLSTDSSTKAIMIRMRTGTEESASRQEVHICGRDCLTYEKSYEAVARFLHQSSTSIYISDGCKFGCDMLLYDGPRDERHAFAGIRIYFTNNKEDLPQPSSYDMTGYVRGMNTAGKLAMLAVVIRSDDCDRLAIIDLELVKVRETISGRKGKTLEERMANLSKNPSSTAS